MNEQVQAVLKQVSITQRIGIIGAALLYLDKTIQLTAAQESLIVAAVLAGGLYLLINFAKPSVTARLYHAARRLAPSIRVLARSRSPARSRSSAWLRLFSRDAMTWLNWLGAEGI